MEVKTFIEKFAEQFEETPMEEFEPETVYKNLEEWNSLMTLSMLAMIDEEYNVEMKNGDFKNTSTIEDLFILVKNRV